MIYFKFEKREPKPVEYRTLADVPDGVRCVVVVDDGKIQRQFVRLRDGVEALATDMTGFGESPSGYYVVQVLDPLPVPPMPKTMADVDEGRCVKYRGENYTYFRLGKSGFGWDERDGTLWKSDLSGHHDIESLKDIYAVRCEVAS